MSSPATKRYESSGTYKEVRQAEEAPLQYPWPYVLISSISMSADGHVTSAGLDVGCAGAVVESVNYGLRIRAGRSEDDPTSETAEILADTEVMKDLRQAEEDIRSGRTVSGDELRRRD